MLQNLDCTDEMKVTDVKRVPWHRHTRDLSFIGVNNPDGSTSACIVILVLIEKFLPRDDYAHVCTRANKPKNHLYTLSRSGILPTSCEIYFLKARSCGDYSFVFLFFFQNLFVALVRCCKWQTLGFSAAYAFFFFFCCSLVILISLEYE